MVCVLLILTDTRFLRVFFLKSDAFEVDGEEEGLQEDGHEVGHRLLEGTIGPEIQEHL